MATNYPSGTDSLTNPAGTSLVTSPDHAAQHTNINDAMEAVQTTVGTTAGTNVLKHFAAGNFPIRATGVAATGTLQQTIVGGTHNSFNGDNGTLGTINTLHGTMNSEVGTIGTLVAGTYTKVNSIPGSALATSAITLGYVEITAQGSSSGTTANTVYPVAGGTLAVTVPSGGRRVKITSFFPSIRNESTGTTDIHNVIKEGGTDLQNSYNTSLLANVAVSSQTIYSYIPSAGAHTYNMNIYSGGNGRIYYDCNGTQLGFLLVELI